MHFGLLIGLSSLGLVLPWQVAKAQDIPPPNARIEGSVVNLLSGAPLKRAIITFTGRPPLESDANGHFVFAGLEPGTYQLRFSRQGYVDQAYGGHRYSVKPLVLARGEQRKDLVVKLVPLAAIAGRVLDTDGESIVGLEVSALQARWQRGKREWIEAARGITSDHGEYRLVMLPPGTYLVQTWERDLASASENLKQPMPTAPDEQYPSTFYPGATEEAAATPLRLEPGQELRGIEFRPTPFRVFRARGSIVKPDGAGDVIMTLSRDGSNKRTGYTISPSESQFEMRGLIPGSYVIEAVIGDGHSSVLARQTFSITDHPVSDVELVFSPAFDIEGTVKVEGATGTPPDLRHLIVNLYGAAVYGLPNSEVAENHNFTLKGVASTHATVEVTGVPDCCYAKSIEFGGAEVTAAGVDLSPGRTLAITLSATAGQIEGSTVDQDGNPVADATVVLFQKAGPLANATSLRSNESGVFHFGGLKPAEYELLAWDDLEPESYFDPDVVKVAEERAQTVLVAASGRHVVRLKATSER